MKRISILLFGLSLAPLFGCVPTLDGAGSGQGAQTPALFWRPIVFEQSQFWAPVPCEPGRFRRPLVDDTEYGTLHSQNFRCGDTADRTYSLSVGVFKDSSSESLDATTKKARNAHIAASIARAFCKEMTRDYPPPSCTPGPPVDIGDMTDVNIWIGIGSHWVPARVRVAFPYLAIVLVIGPMARDSLQWVLNVRLPANGDTNLRVER